ncbi:MAG: hypothetical protein VCA55_16585 [Verrucomicrobiales bacterium]
MASSEAKTGIDSLKMSEFRLPWLIRIMFAAAIVISIGMIIYSSDLEFRALEESLNEEQKAKIIITGERDVLALVAAEAAAEAGELSGEITVIAENTSTLEQQLTESGMWLTDERRIRSGLQDEVSRLSVQMAAFQKREEALQGIIELLESEVVSVENRLDKITGDQLTPQVNLNDFGTSEFIASASTETLQANEHPGSHDAHVVALLNEIGIMNREIEAVREERNVLKAEVDRLAAGKGEEKIETGRFGKKIKGRLAGVGKDDN